MRNNFNCLKLLALSYALPAFVWGQTNVVTKSLPEIEFNHLNKYLSFELYYTHDYVSNTGGVKQGPRNIGAIDMYLESDLNKYSGIQGDFQIHYLHIHGNDQRGQIGDLQFASNIDSPTQIDRMADLWYQQRWSDQFKTLIGIHDMSMEFNTTPSSWKFLNASFGTAADLTYAGPNGPSIYPVTAVGFRAKYELTDYTKVMAGIYDANPGGEETFRSFHSDIGNTEGYMAIAEIYQKIKKQKIGFGGWTNEKKQSRQQKAEDPTPFGFYTMAEKSISDSLFTFVRYSWATPVANPIQSNAVTGLMYRGLLQTRKNLDEVGVGVSQIHIAKKFRDSLKEENEASYGPKETVYEFYYQFRPTKTITFRPDFQFIKNPSGAREVDDAMVFALRTVVEI